MRPVSLIVFDVTIESEEHADTEVFHQMFARSPGIHLRTLSPLTYQSGDYERTLSEPEVWTGRLERIRTDPISALYRDDQGSFRFADETTAVSTTHARTYYAVVPSAGLLIYRDTAEMPYTRLASYVAGAIRQARDMGFRAACEITPRLSDRSLREWLQRFATIERVRVELKHSQSPGNRAVDSILERLNAKTATEIVEAPEKESLRKEALLDLSLPIGQAIDHLEKSATNGQADITGLVDGEVVKFSTLSPVERHIVRIDDEVEGLRSPLARFAARLLTIRSRSGN